jgi:hypothetical protein
MTQATLPFLQPSSLPSTVSAWLGVVSRAHVMRGVEGGFAQVCHGKRTPLARMKPGDVLVYYSPGETLGERGTLQAFTAIGRMRDGRVYPFQMSPDFVPHRRDVDYFQRARTVPLAQLKGSLELTASPHWGYALRRGLLPLSAVDLGVIAHAMGATAWLAPAVRQARSSAPTTAPHNAPNASDSGR